MNSTLKNSLIFISIGVVLVLVYIFFIKGDEPEANLVSSTNAPISNVTINTAADNVTVLDSEFSKQILATLSNVKNINLDDSIFSSIAFQSLVDGTIPLVPDNNEGRVNPFAPIGEEGFSTFNSTNLNSFTAPSLDVASTNLETNTETPILSDSQNLETLTTN